MKLGFTSLPVCDLRLLMAITEFILRVEKQNRHERKGVDFGSAIKLTWS